MFSTKFLNSVDINKNDNNEKLQINRYSLEFLKFEKTNC